MEALSWYYETIKIEQIAGSCPACEEYSKKHT